MPILKDIGNGIKNIIDRQLHEVQPYQCKICQKWKTMASPAKRICRQCYTKIKQEEEEQ